MKLMFVSDIHGSKHYCEIMADLFKQEGANKLILLGDLLYHGPRNDLTQKYSPKDVISILNGLKNEILCVRGNCDSEVDQAVLEFPIMADYSTMYLDDKMVFLTHGHLFNQTRLPALKKGDILIHGHTHIKAIVRTDEYMYLNPGSISLPKDDGINSYMIYEDGVFSIRDLKMKELMRT